MEIKNQAANFMIMGAVPENQDWYFLNRVRYQGVGTLIDEDRRHHQKERCLWSLLTVLIRLIGAHPYHLDFAYTTVASWLKFGLSCHRHRFDSTHGYNIGSQFYPFTNLCIFTSNCYIIHMRYIISLMYGNEMHLVLNLQC